MSLRFFLFDSFALFWLALLSQSSFFFPPILRFFPVNKPSLIWACFSLHFPPFFFLSGFEDTQGVSVTFFFLLFRLPFGFDLEPLVPPVSSAFHVLFI